MLQTLKRSGFVTGQVSMDRSTAAYEFLKSAIYDGRVSIPEHAKLREELIWHCQRNVGAPTNLGRLWFQAAI